jgi:hypothetical protein
MVTPDGVVDVQIPVVRRKGVGEKADEIGGDALMGAVARRLQDRQAPDQLPVLLVRA